MHFVAAIFMRTFLPRVHVPCKAESAKAAIENMDHLKKIVNNMVSLYPIPSSLVTVLLAHDAARAGVWT